jgi:hypothetical protein
MAAQHVYTSDDHHRGLRIRAAYQGRTTKEVAASAFDLYFAQHPIEMPSTTPAKKVAAKKKRPAPRMARTQKKKEVAAKKAEPAPPAEPTPLPTPAPSKTSEDVERELEELGLKAGMNHASNPFVGA